MPTNFKLEMQSITVHVFLPEITRQLELSAKSRKVSIHQEIEELEIMADPTRLKQVLLIVLDNALHSTPVGGKIMIRALREADMGKIVITDTGSGIPAEYAEKVFDRFYKIENSKNVAYKGSGIRPFDCTFIKQKQ